MYNFIYIYKNNEIRGFVFEKVELKNFSKIDIIYNLVRFLTYVVFYMLNCLYVKNLTKLYIMYLISLCKYEGQK